MYVRVLSVWTCWHRQWCGILNAHQIQCHVGGRAYLNHQEHTQFKPSLRVKLEYLHIRVSATVDVSEHIHDHFCSVQTGKKSIRFICGAGARRSNRMNPLSFKWKSLL